MVSKPRNFRKQTDLIEVAKIAENSASQLVDKFIVSFGKKEITCLDLARSMETWIDCVKKRFDMEYVSWIRRLEADRIDSDRENLNRMLADEVQEHTMQARRGW